jgi:hypothetical protein
MVSRSKAKQGTTLPQGPGYATFHLIMEVIFSICFQNKYLVWDEVSFKWSLVPLGGSSYYITAAFGPTLADLLWIEDGNRVSGGTSALGLEQYELTSII